jgi:hypothetical protein
MPLYRPTTSDANLLTTGEELYPRDTISAAACPTGTGTMRLSYFTARKSETTTQIRVISGSTAAAATPTLVRIGLFTIDASDGGTLVASTVSDTALFAATNTAYTRSWSSSYAKTAGARYAVGVLVVTGAAAPTLAGVNFSAAAEGGIAPRISANVSSQTDLPASFVAGSLASSGSRFYAVVLP